MTERSILTDLVRGISVTHILATVGIVALLLLIVGSAAIKNIFICTIFIFMCIVIRFYKRVISNIPIEIEFVTFTIVVLATTFSFWYALFGGIIGFLASEFFNNHINKYIPLSIGFYAVMAVVASILPGSIITVGIMTTIINNSSQLLFYQVIGGFSTVENISYSITNISFNLFIFLKIAPAIVVLLA